MTKDQLVKGMAVRLTADPMSVPAIANALNGTYGLNGEHRSTLPRRDLRRPSYVVKDLANRRGWNDPVRVAIGPTDMGVAFSVQLDQIERV